MICCFRSPQHDFREAHRRAADCAKTRCFSGASAPRFGHGLAENLGGPATIADAGVYFLSE
jgi:hypothetical protein